MKTLPLAALAVFVPMLAAMPARAAIGDWVSNDDKARVRLVVSGTDAAGNPLAAVEIELAPGWKTYWRTPGDAGIPPILDFTASKNVGKVEVGFSPPERHDDGYAVTNVYEGRGVLPLTVGICSDVCVPDHFELALPVAGGASDAGAGAIVEPAMKALPGKPEPGTFAVDSVKPDGGTPKHAKFVISATVPDAEKASVFVEGASDWYADVPEYEPGEGGKALYRFTFDTLGSKTPLDGGKLRITIVSDGRAIEQWVTLP